MEDPADQDKGFQKFLVVGKEQNSGLKMSLLSFDFSEIILETNEVCLFFKDFQENKNVCFFVFF